MTLLKRARGQLLTPSVEFVHRLPPPHDDGARACSVPTARVNGAFAADRRAEKARRERAEREQRLEQALATAQRNSRNTDDDRTPIDRALARADAQRVRRAALPRLPPRRTWSGESLRFICTAHAHCHACGCPLTCFAGERRRVACVSCVENGAEPFAVDISLLPTHDGGRKET